MHKRRRNCNRAWQEGSEEAFMILKASMPLCNSLPFKVGNTCGLPLTTRK